MWAHSLLITSCTSAAGSWQWTGSSCLVPSSNVSSPPLTAKHHTHQVAVTLSLTAAFIPAAQAADMTSLPIAGVAGVIYQRSAIARLMCS